MPLAEGDALWNGLTMGATSALKINWGRLAGLTDQPRNDDTPARLHDAAVPRWARIGWRQITATDVVVDGDQKLRELRAAMADRETIRPFRFKDAALSDDELAVYALADRCEYDKGAIEHSQRDYRPSLQWQAADSTIYSADPTVVAFGGVSGLGVDEKTVTNAGTFATPSGRAWTLTITAKSAVTSPFIRIQAHGESVTWRGLNMTTNQVLRVDENRSSWIGSLGLDGFVRSDLSDFPNWPVMQPGNQTFKVGAVSGLVTAELTYRSAW